MSILKESVPVVSPELADVARRRFTPKFVTISQLLTIVDGDDNAREILCRVVEASFRYAEIVCGYQILVAEGKYQERAEAEPVRTRSHDILIDSVNALSRYFVRVGKDSSWIRTITQNDRAGYMAFGLEIAFEAFQLKEKGELPCS